VPQPGKFESTLLIGKIEGKRRGRRISKEGSSKIHEEYLHPFFLRLYMRPNLGPFGLP
jgi:hypothetical protein